MSELAGREVASVATSDLPSSLEAENRRLDAALADSGTDMDEDVRAYTTETVSELGYRVLEAQDGAAARRIRPGVEVLFTTGYARDAIVHEGRLDAGLELITKSFAFEELAKRLRDKLDRD